MRTKRLILTLIVVSMLGMGFVAKNLWKVVDGVISPAGDWTLSVNNVVMGRSSVAKTGDATLTEAECKGTIITNQGASGEVDLKLDDLSASVQVLFVVEEAQIIEVNPPTDELFDLDGTALDANDCIDSPATVGSKLICTRMQIADASWHWSCDTVRGAWADTGATD